MTVLSVRRQQLMPESMAMSSHELCPTCNHPMPVPAQGWPVAWCWNCQRGAEQVRDVSEAKTKISYLIDRKQYYPTDQVFSGVRWLVGLYPEVTTFREELRLTTILHDVALHGWDHDAVDTLRLLLARGADINARDETGATPLYVAVLSLPHLPVGDPDRERSPTPEFRVGKYNLLTVMLQRGADPNLPTLDRSYPILDAACRGVTSVVELLARYGADPRVSDGSMTLREWAEAWNDADLTTLVNELLAKAQ